MKGEPVEKFYGCLRELSLNCDLGSHEESIIRDVFIANMQDGEIQRELLKETRTAKKTLAVAMKIEMGIQNQLKISGTPTLNTTNEISSQSINSVQGSWNRTRAPTNQFVKPTICPNCGYGIDKTVLLVENLVKIVESLITLQKFVANQNNLVNQNLESFM